MFIKTLESQGTDEQRELFLEPAKRFELISGFNTSSESFTPLRLTCPDNCIVPKGDMTEFGSVLDQLASSIDGTVPPKFFVLADLKLAPQPQHLPELPSTRLGSVSSISDVQVSTNSTLAEEVTTYLSLSSSYNVFLTSSTHELMNVSYTVNRGRHPPGSWNTAHGYFIDPQAHGYELGAAWF
jgi:hypothetical protein